MLRESLTGLAYLRENGMILNLILFLAGVNLVASAFDATLPALILPRETGGETVLGLLVDEVCEPLMSKQIPWLTGLFGTGKGSGAALMMFLLGIAGILICLYFGRKLNKYHFEESV